MKQNTKFLTLYKELEAAIANKKTMSDGTEIPNTVLEFEEYLSEESKNKLRICRQMRNFIQHNDENFLTSSQEQEEFLAQMISEVTGEKRLAKDHMKRIMTPLTEKDNHLAALTMLSKRKEEWVPIVDKSGVIKNAVSYETIGTSLAKGATLKSPLSADTVKKTKFRIAKADDLFVDLDPGVHFIIDDDEKLKGIVIK